MSSTSFVTCTVNFLSLVHLKQAHLHRCLNGAVRAWHMAAWAALEVAGRGDVDRLFLSERRLKSTDHVVSTSCTTIDEKGDLLSDYCCISNIACISAGTERHRSLKGSQAPDPILTIHTYTLSSL